MNTVNEMLKKGSKRFSIKRKGIYWRRNFIIRISQRMVKKHENCSRMYEFMYKRPRRRKQMVKKIPPR